VHINTTPTTQRKTAPPPVLLRWNTIALLAVLCIAAMLPDVAMAAVWDSTANKVLAIFTGGMTRTIAIICVIACGIAALAGKLSWEWVVKIVIGLVLIFGGTAIVDYFIGGFGT
jgi:type IV secretion system protein VirB2